MALSRVGGQTKKFNTTFVRKETRVQLGASTLPLPRLSTASVALRPRLDGGVLLAALAPREQRPRPARNARPVSPRRRARHPEGDPGRLTCSARCRAASASAAARRARRRRWAARICGSRQVETQPPQTGRRRLTRRSRQGPARIGAGCCGGRAVVRRARADADRGGARGAHPSLAVGALACDVCLWRAGAAAAALAVVVVVMAMYRVLGAGGRGRCGRV